MKITLKQLAEKVKQALDMEAVRKDAKNMGFNFVKRDVSAYLIFKEGQSEAHDAICRMPLSDVTASGLSAVIADAQRKGATAIDFLVIADGSEQMNFDDYERVDEASFEIPMAGAGS